MYLFFRFGFLVLVNLIRGIRLGIPAPETYRARTSVLRNVRRMEGAQDADP